jgi:hypothetical protein
MDRKILDFEEGINGILALQENSIIKPYVVSIHGHPNSGKSYASAELLKRGWEKNLRVGLSKARRVTPEYVRDCDLLLLNDTDVFAVLVDSELEKALGRKPDLKVLINNPEMYNMEYYYGFYDMVINNEGSRQK